MSEKWYPGGKLRPITLYDIVRVLGLVEIEHFRKHGKVVKVLRPYDGPYFLRFEDGAISVPLTEACLSNYHLNSVELRRLGILTQKHFNAMGAEEEAIKVREVEENKELRRWRMIQDARDAVRRPLEQRRKELEQRASHGLLDLEPDELPRLQAEAQELKIELQRIKELPIGELLTAEQLEEYQAI